MLALYLLAEDRPRQFPTHRGFVFQLARRLRALAEANCGVWHDSLTGKAKRVYRDVPPRVTERVGTMVVEALGSGALSFARGLAQRAEMERRSKDQLRQALGELMGAAA